MHEEFKNKKMTPIPKAEECTIKLFKETEATIVKIKIKIKNRKKIMTLEDYVVKTQVK